MRSHQVTFSPSGRSTLVPDGATILQAAELAAEPLARRMRRPWRLRPLPGARFSKEPVPEYRVLQRESGYPHVLACLTPVAWSAHSSGRWWKPSFPS